MVGEKCVPQTEVAFDSPMPYLGDGEGHYLGALTTVDAVEAEASSR